MTERIRIDVNAPSQPLEDKILDEELFPYFIEEAEEIMAKMKGDLKSLRGDTTNDAVIDDLRRGFHTLKSAARSIGLMRFGHAAYHAEILCKSAAEDKTLCGEEFLHVLVFTASCLEEFLSAHANRIPFDENMYASIHKQMNLFRQKKNLGEHHG
ncbi:Hpt domain-containing protein [Kamptonema cortianum]|nr:Hpt domain-containing protein [Oscillatoria laete-virens]MDK3161849.1 Hpt domain-containing protein [Kamptonema cortianum]MDL5054419.1 Hpt domain-containing protein [Oscillatoria laete-virens NRMC-F 0139]